MSAETEKYQQAWKRFLDVMASLKKRRSEIIASIFKKLDQRKMESLRREIHGDA